MAHQNIILTLWGIQLCNDMSYPITSKSKCSNTFCLYQCLLVKGISSHYFEVLVVMWRLIEARGADLLLEEMLRWLIFRSLLRSAFTPLWPLTVGNQCSETHHETLWEVELIFFLIKSPSKLTFTTQTHSLPDFIHVHSHIHIWASKCLYLSSLVRITCVWHRRWTKDAAHQVLSRSFCFIFTDDNKLVFRHVF